jgi:1-acyl-sn-glycerol-3-phosphate acyltransferase
VDLYAIGRGISNTYFKLFNRIEVIGKENVPPDKGILLCSNHINNLDPPLVGCAFPRVVHFMAKAELFNVPVLKFILPRVNAFPIRRGMSDKQALRKGLSLLKEGEVLGLFPEGTRSKTGQIGKGLAGAGFFALKSDAIIIPCAVMGSYKWFQTIRIVYGEPIDFSEYRERKASAQEATDLIMEHIQLLIDQNKF